MPWSNPKQATAIFLKKRRKVGDKKAREFMHRHGHKSDQTKRKERAALQEMRRRKHKR